MRTYDPRKLVGENYATNRHIYLERIQRLIDKGLAITKDGEKFVSRLSEDRVRRELGA